MSEALKFQTCFSQCTLDFSKDFRFQTSLKNIKGEFQV